MINQEEDEEEEEELLSLLLSCRNSPGTELWAMITSVGKTRLDNFWTSEHTERTAFMTVLFLLFRCGSCLKRLTLKM